jgi:hypothetical protein
VGEVIVLPDAVRDVVDRLRIQSLATGLVPAQAVASAANESGLSAENIDDAASSERP